jgi:hypothetical protein
MVCAQLESAAALQENQIPKVWWGYMCGWPVPQFRTSPDVVSSTFTLNQEQCLLFFIRLGIQRAELLFLHFGTALQGHLRIFGRPGRAFCLKG